MFNSSECERAISALRPKHLVFENVPALLSSKFMSTFIEWVRTLEGYGYTNSYSIMNASDYGVPQSRKRVFMVSTLGGDRPYVFPKPFKLDPNAIGNAMECDVAPKYYLNDMRLGVFVENEKHKTAARRVIKTLTTQSGVVEMELLNGVGDFAASTLTTAHDFAGNIVNPRGGHKQMGILEKITGNTAEGTSGICEREITENGRRKRIRIRKLTERECFRLMDVDEACIDKVMETGIAKAKLTKMAGNSIVVACLYHIFKGLFGESVEQPSLF